MFDRNLFKASFKQWVEGNLHASRDEAISFCLTGIPKENQLELAWLIEQSVNWFSWRKEQYDRDLEQRNKSLSTGHYDVVLDGEEVKIVSA